MFAIIYCAAICISVSQLKIVPILDVVVASLGISYAEVSWLMSVFTFAGIILALPAGGLIARFGPKKIYLTVMAILVAANVMGGFCLTNFPLLLVSRALEGVAFAMCSIAGVVFINMWFPKRQGTFNGIFSTFAAVASFGTLNLMLPLYQAVGLQGVWFVVAGMSAVFTVLVALVVKEAVPAEGGPVPEMPAVNTPQVLKTVPLMALALGQIVIGFVLYFFINNYPTIFMNVYGLDPATANFYGSLNGLWGIPFCILGGLICDKLGPKRTVGFMMFCFVGLAITCLISMVLPSWMYIPHTFFTAVFAGMLITAGVYLVPYCVRNPNQIGMGVSMQTLCYNLGVFMGNPILMYAIQSTGNWNSAAFIMTAVCAFGCATVVLYATGKKKFDAVLRAADQTTAAVLDQKVSPQA